MEIPPKIKNRTAIWSNNSTSVYLPPPKLKTLIRKGMCTPLSTAVLFIIAKILKKTTNTLVSLSRIDKEDTVCLWIYIVYTYIHNRI